MIEELVAGQQGLETLELNFNVCPSVNPSLSDASPIRPLGVPVTARRRSLSTSSPKAEVPESSLACSRACRETASKVFLSSCPHPRSSRRLEARTALPMYPAVTDSGRFQRSGQTSGRRQGRPQVVPRLRLSTRSVVGAATPTWQGRSIGTSTPHRRWARRSLKTPWSRLHSQADLDSGR